MANRRAVTENDMISINILTLDSRRYLLRVQKEILIGQLKEEIARPSGVPREHQLLLYHAQRLKDDKTLSHYNVENGDTLHLVTQQPNASPSDLNPPAPVSEDHAPFNIHFHGHGSAAYTNQILSALITGLVMNHTINPAIQPEDPYVMTSLTVELTDLSRRSSQWGGGGFSVARFPSEQPLVGVLQSASSLLNNIALTVYILRFLITHQRSNRDVYEQRIRNEARILRDQLWRSLQYLSQLGHVMNDIIRQPPPTMPPPPPPPPPPPTSSPSQPERTRSRRNNGASSSNSNDNAAGTSSQNSNASEYVEYGNRRASDRPRDPRPNRRRRNNI